MIEVFKTNVQTKSQARQILRLLESMFEEATANFDLEDRDKILRVKGIDGSQTRTIICDLNQLGFNCEILN